MYVEAVQPIFTDISISYNPKDPNWNNFEHFKDKIKKDANWAIVIMDMQNKYTSSTSDKDLEKLLESQKYLISKAQSLNLPIISVTTINEKIKESLSQSIEYEEIPGGEELHHTINNHLKYASLFFTEQKTESDAFKGSKLSGLLHFLGVDSILLTGLYGNQCCKMTVDSAIAKGFTVATSPKLILNQNSILELPKISEDNMLSNTPSLNKCYNVMLVNATNQIIYDSNFNSTCVWYANNTLFANDYKQLFNLIKEAK